MINHVRLYAYVIYTYKLSKWCNWRKVGQIYNNILFVSNDITEIFLQYQEQTLLKHLMENKTIEYYTRYVDDILIIYNTDHTNMETIFHYINSIHPNITFTPTQEHNKTISFLELHITRKNNKLDINIYRKPTTRTPPPATTSTNQQNTSWLQTDSL